MTVPPGLHVNSDKPKSEFIIPLKLTWASGPLEVKSVIYPAPEQIQVGKDTLDVITGSFELRTDFSVAASAPAGPATASGKLRYQACNNTMCFRPMTIDISVPVTIQ